MESLKLFLLLAVGSISSNLLMIWVLNLGNKGNANGGDGSSAANQDGAAGKAFTQDQVNTFLAQERRKFEQKYGDYDDLKKKVDEFQKVQESQSLKELEEKKNYEKLKENWTKKESEYQEVINKKEGHIKDITISSALKSEVAGNNAFLEAVDLIRPMAFIDSQGSIRVKMKNSDGIETDFTLSEGVKMFLKEKPFLVKATNAGGSGTSASGSNSGGSSSSQGQPENLGDALQKARASGDYKAIQDIKNKLSAKYKGARAVI